jgi:hypothetical protein
MVGTVISVDDSRGIPLEKSIFGSNRGAITLVVAQFTIANAAWLNPRSMRRHMTKNITGLAEDISLIAIAVKQAVESTRDPT